MTAPTFATPVANAFSTLASPYTAGSGSMTLVSAAAFGALSGGAYLRISVFAPNATSTAIAVCHLKVTAITGNTLTIAGPLDGSTDTSVAAGGTVDVAPAVGTFNDITKAIIYNYNNLGGGGNLDGGVPNTNFGSTTPIDGGTP